MTNIFSTANELVGKLKSGNISCVDLCKAYIERIEKFEKDVKAWVFFDKKLLLEKAAEKDEYRKSGKPLGPLHGLPIGIKDIIGTYDMPTECGTVLRKGISESSDASSSSNGGGITKELLRIFNILWFSFDVSNPSKLAASRDLSNDFNVYFVP